jgi:hypothetical protein
MNIVVKLFRFWFGYYKPQTLNNKLIHKIKKENIFYHTCPNKDVESILKYGLLRRKSSLWKKSGGAIYLTRKVCWLDKNKDYTVLKVTLPKEFILNCEIWHINDYLLKNKEWQFVCWRDIPSRYIKKLNSIEIQKKLLEE